MKTKILFVMLLLLSATLIFSSCNSNDIFSDEENNTNEIYINQKGSWSNGVEFEILDHRVTSEIESSLVTYTTQNKFIVLKLQVFNGSADAFSADATDVWLTVNETKIYQQNFVERDVNGFSEINQSSTTTKCYYLVFEVGNDISMDDLKLVIHNGSLLNSETLVIKLKNSPKDCTVTLNYSCERENDAHSFHSGTTIYSYNFPAPEREGYVFLGWYFNADYSGDVLTNYELSEKQELTLYAKWEKLVCVNYDYSYDSKTEKVFLNNGTTFDLPIPERLGYSFDGWYNNKSLLGDAITNISFIAGDVSLYAKWIGNPVYLMYDGNGSTFGEMNNQLFYVGDTLALNENKFSRDGYTFIGWSIEKTSNDIIKDKAEYTMQPTSYEIVKIYAKWAKEIRTADDFNTINANNTEHYVLMNDIDFSSQVAQTIEVFYGVFDGNGYILKNSSKSPFYINVGEIRNVKIENCKTAFYDNSLYAGQLRLSNGEKIQTSLYDNNVYFLRGGLVVYNLGVIKNCSIKVVYSNGVYQEEFGGISGVNEGKLINCCSTINFDIYYGGNGERNIGGLVGRNIYNGVVENCYSIGTISVNNSTSGVVYVGGLIGKCKGGTVTNCYSNVAIYSEFAQRYGGLVGHSFSATINNCFALGKIEASGYVGGLIAEDSSYLLNNSYRSDVNLFAEGTICKSGTLMESEKFYSKDFYIDNNILDVYEGKQTLQENENAVWIITDGELPKLYWE